MVLRVLSDRRYSQGEHDLWPGDRILLYTDGLVEARNAGGEEFGEGRLIEILLRQPQQDPQELQELIVRSVAAFCNGSLQDDSTLIAIHVE